MENRFKYKAWDKINKTISDVTGITGLDKEDNEAFKYICTDDHPNGVKNWKDVELMQCTGAKDINGNLIYEGFIVKEDDSFIKVIEWDEQYAGYGLDTKAYSYEILGNIYQHKHLLEDESN